MAYNQNNYIKQARYIIALYHELKEDDIPDTRIVRSLFPQHGIYMSYRKWMTLKNMSFRPKPAIDPNQASLFS